MLGEYFQDQIYLISTATLLLAVVVALYFSNFLKDDTKQKKENNCENEKEFNNLNDYIEQEKTTNENQDDDMPKKAGILAKIKSARWKTLEAQLTEDQREEERRIEREQFTAIFELLKKKESELNYEEIDENEFNAQMNLYR